MRPACSAVLLLLLPLAAFAESKSLFDGKTLAGWEGDAKTWRVEDGAIVGGSLETVVPRNEFLCTTKTYGDFELKAKFKLLGDPKVANAGIQFRTKRIPNHHEVSGYQADVGQGYWGALYDESRRGVANAFDLSKEDPATVAKYDTAPLVRPDQIDKKWKNYNNYVDNAKSLGKLLLLARRLCEAGAGFVTVTTNFVWDMHADVNNAGVAEGMKYMGLPFDHAVSTFIEDVEARGLDDKIMLVCSGEIGRTPTINKNGGRDHWGNLGPLMIHGGGLKMGQVIGQSTANGGDPATEPIGPRQLVATIMNTLFDTGELRIARGVPDDVLRIALDADPIRQLF